MAWSSSVILIRGISGAISKAEFEKRRHQYKNKLIISYCTIGIRSGSYTRKLLSQGLHAKNLRGGVLNYAHQGLKFFHNNKETKNIHIHNEAWNLLPKGYIGKFE